MQNDEESSDHEAVGGKPAAKSKAAAKSKGKPAAKQNPGKKKEPAVLKLAVASISVLCVLPHAVLMAM